ncbi:MAG TPA: twin-arginine translocase subunit TatB, partial [Caulobacter sp.]|nr:twin-arginine translocase subunit TatB [Caulobacter sp.]
RKRASKDITVDAPKAVRAPRKRAAKAGGSTASDIVS